MVRIDHARPSRRGFSEIRFGLWGYVQGYVGLHLFFEGISWEGFRVWRCRCHRARFTVHTCSVLERSGFVLLKASRLHGFGRGGKHPASSLLQKSCVNLKSMCNKTAGKSRNHVPGLHKHHGYPNHHLEFLPPHPRSPYMEPKLSLFKDS